MPSLARRLWKWFAGLFAALAILSALIIGAFRVAADQLPEYRTPIEQWASRMLGLPVEIGGMDARLGFDGPEILLRDAAIFSTDGNILLQADTASLSLDVSELLFAWQLKGDRFTVDGPQLDIRRDAGGEIYVLGIPVSSIKPRGQALLAEIRLRGGRVVFDDELEGASWVFRDADVDLSGDDRELRVDFTLGRPGELARRISGWTVATVNEAGVYSDWRVSVWLEGLGFPALHRLAGLQWMPKLTGEADMRLWLDLRGAEPLRVSAETTIRGLAMADAMTAPDGAGYQLIEGRFDWDRLDPGWRLQASDLQVRRAEREWRNSEVEIKSVPGDAGASRLSISAERVRLHDLVPLVTLLPDEALRDSMLALNPRGDLEQMSLAVETTAGDQSGYGLELDVIMDEVAFDPWQKAPGVSGLNGRVRSDRRGGRIELDSEDVSLNFPDLFRSPLALTRLGGLVVWSHGSDGLTIIGDELDAASADLDLELGFRLRLASGDDPGVIDLEARMEKVDLASASTYLPAGVMSPRVVGWLDRALIGGTARDVDAVIHGPLKGFPYRNDEGLFRVTYEVEDMDLDYARGWMPGEAVRATMEFENEGLSATLHSGRMGGLSVADVEVSLPDLPAGQLSIRGPARGDFSDLQRYLLDSPVAPRLGEGFARLRVEEGQTETRVDLLLPLRDLAATRVNAEIDISDAALGYGYVPHTLAGVNGTLIMRGPRFSGQGLTATLFGEPVLIDVEPREDGSTRAYASGTVTAASLADPVGMPLASYMQGTSEWRGFVHFPGPQPGDSFFIQLESQLEGMSIGLPAPLEKPAPDRLPLTVDFRFPDARTTEWDVLLAGRLAAMLRFNLLEQGLEFYGATVQTGSGESPSPARPGLVIGGYTGVLSVDDWLEIEFGEGEGASPEEILTAVDLFVNDLRVINQHFGDASVRLSQADGAWQAEIESESASGVVTIPFELYGTDPLIVDMQRLAIDDEDEDEDGSEGSLDPKLVPAASISIVEFSLESIRLGSLDGSIERLPDGFRTDGLRMRGDGFELELAGSSQLSEQLDESRFTLVADSGDVGGALEFMGFASGVDAEKGRFSADLSWNGGIPASILAVAEGTAKIDIEQGSLTDVEPGTGRVFGLLSIQALPRRLVLDFRDIFQKGFFFERFRGDFRIAGGEAYSDNLVLKGRAADIGIVGTVGLMDRRYDQVAVVSAEVGNTLPVVGAIAGGPAVGAGLFVLKELFKDSLSGIIRAQYTITGPWDDPQVERVALAEAGRERARPDGDAPSASADTANRERP